MLVLGNFWDEISVITILTCLQDRSGNWRFSGGIAMEHLMILPRTLIGRIGINFPHLHSFWDVLFEDSLVNKLKVDSNSCFFLQLSLQMTP